MPASPGMRFSPGREHRGNNHKRGRSFENGIVFKERDDDNLALFNEMQGNETANFLLQSNDDFEDNLVTMRNFSDQKLGINIGARGESSNLLNAEEEKNDYEWLITPPDTPLFPSLDDEAPQVIHQQRGRPGTQPISFSRSSTMEKSNRSSRGSPSPNRLSPSPRSREPVFQPRNRASSVPSSSPPPSRRPNTGSKRPSSPSSKPSTPPLRASTPPSRRLSTGSSVTISGNSASPKIKAWQANIPGFSTEAPPNLRTSLADRPGSYIRGSSPASKNRRQSMSPVASRSIGSFHSSKGSIASSVNDDDVEYIQSVIVDGSERSNLRKVGGFRNNNNNKAPIYHNKPIRNVSSSSAPKRSFDMALRQMDHRKGPQNMFRPLLSSVPSANFYAGKGGPTTPAWNSSVTTSSNASSDFGTSGGPLDIEQHEDDATSGYVKSLDHNIIDGDDEVFIFEKPESVNEYTENDPHDISPNEDNFENIVQCDSLKDMLICSRCGCGYSDITQKEDDVKLCPNCRKSTSSLTVSDSMTSLVVVTSSLEESTMSDKYHELVKVESPKITSESEAQSEQNKYVNKDGESTKSQPTVDFPDSLSEPRLEECESTEVNHQVIISQPSLSYGDEKGEQIQQIVDFPKSTVISIGGEQIQHTVDFPKSTVNSVGGEQIQHTVDFPKSTSIIGPVIRSGNFSASSISYDDFSYMRASTNSMRSSIGRGSVSASSSVDFGPRFHRQLSSRKSDIENYKYDPMNVKYRRSVSSLSGTSSHAFRPSSVGTSTLDSFEVSIGPIERDVADSASVGPQETQSEHDIENEGVVNIETDIDSEEVLLPESLNIDGPISFSKVDDLGKDSSTSTTCTLEKVENLGNDNNALTTYTFEKVEDLGKGTSALLTCTFEKVEDLGNDTSALTTCTFDKVEDLDKDTSVLTTSTFEKVEDLRNDPSTSTTCTLEKVEDLGNDTCALMTCTSEKVEDLENDTSALMTCTFDKVEDLENDTSDFADVQLDAISEKELDQTYSASQCNLSQSSESSNIEEIRDPHVMECNTSTPSTSIIMEESTVLVEGQGKTKGRSLTLEEATDTILFCSSIVHNLAYEAATIAIDKATQPDFPNHNNNSFPLTPAVPKGYSGQKDCPAQKTSKGSSKYQKTREKKTNSTKDPNRTNICEENDLPKTRIVYPNNKENTKPPKIESKCNCVIM